MKALENYVKGGKFFKSVVEDGSDIIFIVDFQGIIHYHNPSVKGVLGYNRNSLVGKNFFDYVLPQTVGELRKRYKTSTQKKFSASVEFQFLCRNKSYKYLEFNSINLKFKEGISGLILDCRDITQRKKDAQELLRAQKAKELFLANISHEIRTPINGIAGMASLLGNNPLPEDQLTYINAIKSASDNLKVIINDILDLASIESGKLKFENIGFSLTDLLATLENLFTIQAKEKRIVLNIHVAKSANKILLGDPVRLNQILTNLISNAIKFTHSGFIKVAVSANRLSSKKLNLKITIEDTGIGIPVEKQSAIFESFNQADASVTRKYGGTGLGLTIVKQLVELQKGTVSVESKENIGSVFLVTIPYSIGTLKNIVDKPLYNGLTKNSNTLKDFSVLLVEDNEINRLYASSIIKAWGCNFDTAENGYEAIQKLKSTSYSVVLMDIQMPIMDGFETTKAIRSFNSAIKNVPIVAITANATKKDIEKCKAAGMNDCIAKPFTPEELFSILIKNIKATRTTPKKLEHHNVMPNLAYLNKVSNGNKDFMKDMINTVLKAMPALIDEIDRLNTQPTITSLCSAIHKIKPSLTMLGLPELKDEAMNLEELFQTRKNTKRDFIKVGLLCDNVRQALEHLKVLQHDSAY
jgi:PAS domain S-box-containing protein